MKCNSIENSEQIHFLAFVFVAFFIFYCSLFYFNKNLFKIITFEFVSIFICVHCDYEFRSRLIFEYSKCLRKRTLRIFVT